MAKKSFSVHTYSPSDVILTVGGYDIDRWESITIARNAQGFTPVRGIRGKNTRVINKDTSAVIQIPILQTSQSNEVLSGIHSQDLVNGTGRLVLMLKDGSGNSVFTSNEAYILGYPETVFSGTFEYRIWSLYCQTTATYIIGGNARPSTSLFDSVVNEISNLASRLL